ncbi:MAG: hypothetical protein Ct9H90mP24_7520 [Methanobacteriota archaeon]|nr:MAG: hypothetical protein Ct9H90mP24_7520 [Euryarchaeota archaeon]
MTSSQQGGLLSPSCKKLEEMGAILKGVVIAIEKGEREREFGPKERPNWPIQTLAKIDIVEGRVEIVE